MSEDNQDQGQTNLPAPVQRVREIRVVHSDLPMYDTASFEHLGRVAAIMAQAELLPRTLTHVTEGSGNNRQEIALPMEVVKARALLIANQARLWDMDPLAVAQCTSLVHNRLMYEGKLVHAVVEAKVGIRLSYEFGLWDTDHFTPASGDELNGAGERLAVRVIGKFDDEDEARTVEGSVGAWKTTGTNSPWTAATAWRRQLRYRGAREWARAHSPGVVLGIVTDDEDHEMMTSEPMPRQVRVKRDLKARLAAPVEPPTNEPAPEVEATLETTDSGDVIDTNTGEVIEETNPQGASDAPTVEEGNDTPASATDASDTSPAPEVSGQEEDQELAWWQKTDITDGHAKVGEVYRLASDEAGADGKVPTYCDGVAFSSAGEKGSIALNVYRGHSPVVDAEAQDDEEGGGDHVDETATEQAPATSSAPRGGVLGEMDKCDSWLTIKPIWVANMKSEQWMDGAPEDQEIFKAEVRAIVERLRDKEGKPDPVNPAEDPTYFTIWLAGEDTAEGADLIEATLATLEKSAKWGKLNAQQQERVTGQAEAKINALRGEG